MVKTTQVTFGPGISRGLPVLSGFAWAGLSVAILSGWFIVTRLGLWHSLHVWDVIALRFGEGAILLTPTLLVGPSRLPLRAWKQGLDLAFLWGAPFILLVATGLGLTSAAFSASLVPPLMTIFAGAILWTMSGEAPRTRQISGYALIAGGLALLTTAYILAEGLPNPLGVSALVAAAAMWATYSVRLRGRPLSPLQAAALICFWSAIAYLPVYFWSGISNLGSASWQELLLQSLYQGLMTSVVAIFAFNRAIASLSPRAAAAIAALVPATTTALSILFLGEPPSLSSAVSVCVIATGVMLAAASPVSQPSLSPTGTNA